MTLVAAGLWAPPSVAEEELPKLDHEPLLRVLVARAHRVPIRLLAPVRLDLPGRSLHLPKGEVVVEVAPAGWRIQGRSDAVSGTGVLQSGGRAAFQLDAIPIFGDPRPLRLAGDLLISTDGEAVQVVERIPMEAYLASVVGAEMKPHWPDQALAAQAIVARSYAAARWMERFEEPWQLHWHFGVDMAYHGYGEQNRQVAAAIASTRGEVLLFGDFPVLALFHASSGGRTEAFDRVKPGVFAPDGKTPIAAAMPVVDDDAALPAARELALEGSHGRWRAELTLEELSALLQGWSAAAEGRPSIGRVVGVSIFDRHADSGRVSRVSVGHVLEGHKRFTTLPATVFRLAVGPVLVRSVWWESCVVTGGEPASLRLVGRGYGHGCGLSQVSAWYLAKQGRSAEEIVARFYAGARIERRY